MEIFILYISSCSIRNTNRFRRSIVNPDNIIIESRSSDYLEENLLYRNMKQVVSNVHNQSCYITHFQSFSFNEPMPTIMGWSREGKHILMHINSNKNTFPLLLKKMPKLSPSATMCLKEHIHERVGLLSKFFISSFIKAISLCVLSRTTTSSAMHMTILSFCLTP